MKARILSYYEIEDRFKDILSEMARRPMDDESIVEKGVELLFLLGVCVSQMKAPNSASHPQKAKQLAILENALAAITYKINSCTVEEVTTQVNVAYRGFGIH